MAATRANERLAQCPLLVSLYDVVANCLRNVRAKHADVKFLGSYPATGEDSNQVRAEASEAWQDAADWMDSLRSQIVR